MTTRIVKDPTSCFSVIDPENERGEIIFADTDKQAIALYLLQYDEDELPDPDAIRAVEHPEWAHYAAAKAVPIIEQIKSGHWSYECHFCLSAIPAEPGDSDIPDDVIVWPTDETFCSCFCASRYISRRRNHNIMEDAARNWICEEITSHCPDKTVVNVTPHVTDQTIHTIRATIAEASDPSQISFLRIDFPENNTPPTFALQAPYSLKGQTSGCFDNLNTALQTIISRKAAQ